MGKGLLSRLFGRSSSQKSKGWAEGLRRTVKGFVRGGYEAADSNRLNKKHWGSASGSSADALIFQALETLRNRARHETRNNGYAEGMIETYAADCVGPVGPQLQIEFGNESWNEDVEDGWRGWTEQCDLAGRMHFADKLRLFIRQFFEAGEAFEQKVSADVDTPVRLRLLSIEPDRVDSPNGFDDANVRKGVKVDGNGAPLSYYVSKTHPGNIVWSSGLTDYDELQAKDVYHLYKLNRPGQTRGVPWLAPVLDVFGHFRDLDHHTLLAAEYAAALAVLLYTDHTDAEYDDCGGVYDIVDIEEGSMAMLPRGWKATQIKPEQPPVAYPEYKKELLKQIGRPVGMPYLVIGADAAGHNYSSARLDTLTYWDHLEMTQASLARHCCTPLVREWIAEARLAGVIGRVPPKFRITWTWPQRKHVDQLKEEQAAILRLASGRTTWAKECKAQGMDWEEVFRQLKREREKAQELGLGLDFGTLVLAAKSIIAEQKKKQDEEDDE